MSVKPPDPALIDKLVYANRILYDQGVVDGLGHVSVRHDTEPGVFLLSCNRAPGMVRRQDIVCYDYDGNAVSEATGRPYLERFIHGEIYRARPDVMAVVHSHSPSVHPVRRHPAVGCAPSSTCPASWAAVRRISRSAMPAATPTC